MSKEDRSIIQHGIDLVPTGDISRHISENEDMMDGDDHGK